VGSVLASLLSERRSEDFPETWWRSGQNTGILRCAQNDKSLWDAIGVLRDARRDPACGSRLAAGETKTVTLDQRYISVFDVASNRWKLVAGECGVHVGGASDEAGLKGTARLQ
jgi:hypothetical protein